MNRYHSKRLRILAVDDDTNILDIYQNSIILMNGKHDPEKKFELTLCRQGDEALNTVHDAIGQNDPFAIIFLDLKLPPGPDAELLEKERAAEAKAAEERQRLISGKQMGYMSTILTGGTGVEEEANVGKTLLGGR